MPDNNRIISENVLGSANPLSRFGRKLSDSISGIIFGVILIALSFGLVWWAEKQPEHSKTVAALALQTDVPATQSGMVKIQAVPAVTQVLIEPKTNAPVLFYHYLKQEFKKVKETRRETKTVVQNGQDVQQTIERDVYVEKWVDLLSDKKWAAFRLSNLNVTATNADVYATYTRAFEQELPVTNAPLPPEGSTPDMYPATKTREIVDIIPATTPILLVGDAQMGSVTGGVPFIISDKTNDALIAQMQTDESRLYWGFKIAAWLIMTIGFTLLFAPISTFLNILPGLGKAVNAVIFVVFGVVSLVLVALGTLAIRYWWAVVVALVGLIALLIIKLRTKTLA